MIQIEDVDWDIDELKSNVVGCGIIPYSINEDGKYVVLLGQETFVARWRGSLKWSGFEGGRKFGESVEISASREFIEESMGVVSIDGVNNATIEDVHQFLLQKKFMARVLVCILHENNGEQQKRYQLTYLINIPYDEKCTHSFEKLRADFLDLNAKLIEHKKMLNTICNNELPFIREGSIVKGNKVKAIIDVFVSNKNELVVTYLEECGIQKLRKEVPNNETLSLYLRWFSSRLHLDKEVKAVSNLINAISIERNCNGLFVDATINEEYLEKQAIKWWDLDTLNKVLQYRGNYNGDFFRAYFLPVLQRCIQELEKH